MGWGEQQGRDAALATAIRRRCAIGEVAERLVDALDEQRAASDAWPTGQRPTELPDLTQDEIDAIGMRQRAADGAVVRLTAELRSTTRRSRG